MGEMSENPLRVPASEVIELLNAAKYVDLRQISEPNKNVFNSLRIVVEEAVGERPLRWHPRRPHFERMPKAIPIGKRPRVGAAIPIGAG